MECPGGSGNLAKISYWKIVQMKLISYLQQESPDSESSKGRNRRAD